MKKTKLMLIVLWSVAYIVILGPGCSKDGKSVPMPPMDMQPDPAIGQGFDAGAEATEGIDAGLALANGSNMQTPAVEETPTTGEALLATAADKPKVTSKKEEPAAPNTSPSGNAFGGGAPMKRGSPGSTTVVESSAPKLDEKNFGKTLGDADADRAPAGEQGDLALNAGVQNYEDAQKGDAGAAKQGGGFFGSGFPGSARSGAPFAGGVEQANFGAKGAKEEGLASNGNVGDLDAYLARVGSSSLFEIVSKRYGRWGNELQAENLKQNFKDLAN